MIRTRLTVLMLTLGLLSACDDAPEPPAEVKTPVTTDDLLPQTDTVRRSATTELLTAQDAYRDHLLALASEHYDIALSAIQKLNADISDLLESPTAAALAQARVSWRNAYSAYLQTLPLTAIDVNEPDDWKLAGLTRAALTESINPWPVEPGYVDYIDGYPYTGIVNDTTLNLSEGSLQEQHRFADASYISLGFQVMEFLLWGEDGQRPAQDFDSEVSANATPTRPVVKNQDRRGEYLKTAGQMLQKNLQRLQLRWQKDNGFYSITSAVRSGPAVLNNNLISLRQLLSRDVAGRYLKQPSSPFSQTSPEDVRALLHSTRILLLPVMSQNGVRTLLAETPEKTERLDLALAGMDDCLDAITQYPACQAEMLELLTAFDKAASQLDPAVLFPVNAWAEPVLTQPSDSGSQE